MSQPSITKYYNSKKRTTHLKPSKVEKIALVDPNCSSNSDIVPRILKTTSNDHPSKSSVGKNVLRKHSNKFKQNTRQIKLCYENSGQNLKCDGISEKASCDEAKISSFKMKETDEKLAEILGLTVDHIPKIISPLPLTPEHKRQTISSDVTLMPAPESPTLNKTAVSDMKMKLQTCGKLAELQERLLAVNNCSQKLKELRARHPYSPKKTALSLSPQSSPGKISPLGSPRKINNRFSPVKRQLKFLPPAAKTDDSTTKKDIPAYQRFQALAAPPSSSLILPYSYKILAEFFRCVDTVVSMLHNRHEICTFVKIKKAVEEMMGKKFTLSRLAQIKTVFPLGYFFKQEKNDKDFNSKSKYELHVSPNLEATHNEVQLTSEYVEATVKNEVPEINTSKPVYCATQMNSSCLLDRRDIFKHNLLEIVRKHHDDFLSTLNPPIHVPRDKLTVWHPKLNIDLLPEVPESHLPLPPTVRVYENAKDVLSKAVGVAGSGTKVEKALEKVIKDSEAKNISGKNQEQTKPKIEVKSALQGISQSLLDKIRAKEAAKIAQDMQRTPAENSNRVMMERFPDFIRIIRTFFISERKIALPIDNVIKKLSESYESSLPPSAIEEHLKLLSNTFPTWLMILKLKKGIFIKIDKNKNLADLDDKLKQCQKTYS